MGTHYYFHQCIIDITLSNESSPLSAIVCVIFVILYTLDTFNSFWKNQTLFETIVMRKNVIDRMLLTEMLLRTQIIESIKNVYSSSMVLTM